MKKLRIILFGLIGIVLAWVLVMNLQQANRSRVVEYQVEGTAKSALVSYINDGGGTEQVETSLPWEKKFEARRGVSLSLVAQNDGGGKIICRIVVDGMIVKTSETTAAFGVVTCAYFIQ